MLSLFVSRGSLTPHGAHARIGFDKVKRGVAALKPTSQAGVMALVDKIEKSTAAAPAPAAAAAPAPAAPAAAAAPASDEGAVKKKASSTAVVPAKGKADAKAEDPADNAVTNDGKRAQREKDEKSLKVSCPDLPDSQTLKWNFTAPRPEFLQQLQDQVRCCRLLWYPAVSCHAVVQKQGVADHQARSCLGRTLLANMFGDDFRGHLRAMDALSEAVRADAAAVLACSDIVFKWITLRFFDTNTAVLLRTLQLLQVGTVLARAHTHSQTNTLILRRLLLVTTCFFSHSFTV